MPFGAVTAIPVFCLGFALWQGSLYWGID